MNDNKDNLNLSDEKFKSFSLIYISLIIIITFFLILLRVIFYFIDFSQLPDNIFAYLFIRNRDLNFTSIYNLMDNGLCNFYNENSIINDRAIYLYFWYFIFYPFYIIPFEISIYIWDLLRLISTIYIAKNIYRISLNKTELLFFFILNGIGYFADMYLNNTNWLIQILLFQSYIQLEKNRKILSGTLFAITTFKIILIIFPFVLIISKKIKIKDLIYYLFPLLIIAIPYIIFPNYFLQMVLNWIYHGEQLTDSFLFNLFFVFWRVIQAAHLIFISLILLIFFESFKNKKWKRYFRVVAYTWVISWWVLIWLIFIIITIFI